MWRWSITVGGIGLKLKRTVWAKNMACRFDLSHKSGRSYAGRL